MLDWTAHQAHPEPTWVCRSRWLSRCWHLQQRINALAGRHRPELDCPVQAACHDQLTLRVESHTGGTVCTHSTITVAMVVVGDTVGA